MKRIAQYCQKCRAANPPGENLCLRCGTRLMLVVVPPSVRHDEIFPPNYYEDHLLERVTLLELRLGQVIDRLSASLDIMMRQTKHIEAGHQIMENLLDALNAAGVFDRETVKQKIAESERNEQVPTNPEDEIFRQIIFSHDHPNTEIFTALVKDGFEMLKNGDEKQGLRVLERAVALSPRNILLMTFAAEKNFLADNFETAEKLLDRAREIAPQEPKILLLSGVIYAEKGKSEEARKILSLLINHTETAFCVNYVWAFLAASEEKWSETLAAFKEVLRLKDIAETQYLTACACFQMKKFSQARKHLQKAVEHDENFSDAWFMLGVTTELLGDAEKSAEAFAKAAEVKESGAQSPDFLRRKNVTKIDAALPFLRLRQRPKNLLTGNARRLAKLFREELFKLL